jgi:hypothetical protein
MTRLALLALLCAALPAHAQEKLYGTNIDTRIGLAYKVSDAAVRKLLPAGWEVNAPAAGPTRGANLNMTLVDSISAQDADGKPVKPNVGIAFTVPVKKTATGETGAMVVAGMFSPHYAPGAYGVFLPAKINVERKLHTDPEGKTSADETWDVKGEDGHSIQIHVRYERAIATRGKVEAKVYSGAKPDFFRIYRFEQASDVARSTATGVDRVSAFSLKVSGPKLPVFDGSEELIAVTSIPWYSRQVYLPAY